MQLQVVPQRIEERRPDVGNLALLAIARELDCARICGSRFAEVTAATGHVAQDTFIDMRPFIPPPPVSRFGRSPLSRRTFVGGIVGSAALTVAACGGSTTGTEDESSVDQATTTDPPLLLSTFPDGIRQPTMLAAVGTQRAIFGISRGSGFVDADDAPAEIAARLTHPDGTTTDVMLPRHSREVPRHYYPLVFEPTGVGSYLVDATIEGSDLQVEFLVAEPADVPLLQIGDQLPSLDTPTVADARGVTPICTRAPECDLHDITVADAIAAGQPVALMVSTPAFCQTGICGPTLEIMLGQLADAPDIAAVHAEVYTDPTKLGSSAPADLLAPTVNALGMTFEPSLIVANAAGIVTARLDIALDADDIAEALASGRSSF